MDKINLNYKTLLISGTPHHNTTDSYRVFLLNDRLASSVPLPVQTSVEVHVGYHQHTYSYVQMMRNTSFEF